MISPRRFFSVFRTAARGLEAQRIEIGTAAENMANATTSRTADGTPYAIKRAVREVEDEDYRRFSEVLNRSQKKMVAQSSQHMEGARLRRKLHETELGPITEVEEVNQERLEYDPTHPHADADGYVRYPDVNVAEEMVRMISANRIYEANLATIESAKEMIKRTLEI